MDLLKKLENCECNFHWEINSIGEFADWMEKKNCWTEEKKNLGNAAHIDNRRRSLIEWLEQSGYVRDWDGDQFAQAYTMILREPSAGDESTLSTEEWADRYLYDTDTEQQSEVEGFRFEAAKTTPPSGAGERTEEKWWEWHDKDSARWSADTDDGEERARAWVAGESDDGPEED